MENKTLKKRNWAFVLYLDSAPSNWKEILQLKGVMCAISPFHDKDVDPTGEPKKPHYHIILSWDNPTTYNNVLSLTKELNATIPIPLESVKGMYRYLTHKDNPEKYQYCENDIILLNGFDINDLLNSTEVFNIMKHLIEIIRACDIKEYSDLVDYLKDMELYEDLNVCVNKTIFLNTYISSRRHKNKVDYFVNI